MLDNLLKKYISKDFDIGYVMIPLTIIIPGLLFAYLFSENSPNLKYESCIEKAIEDIDRSAEILSICKELK